MKTLPILAALLLLPAAATLAADGARPKRDPLRLLRGLDKNGDGVLSYEEWSAGMVGSVDPARMPVLFKQKDADSNGTLTLAEFIYIPAAPAAATPPKAPKVHGDQKPAAPEKR